MLSDFISVLSDRNIAFANRMIGTNIEKSKELLFVTKKN